MAAHITARPVSGEILTDGQEQTACGGFRAGAAFPPVDIVDADWYALDDVAPAAPPRRKEPGGEEGRAGRVRSAEGMAVLLGKGTGQTRSSRERASPVFWLGGFSIIAASFWIAGGHMLVSEGRFLRSSPKSALSIFAVTSRIDDSGVRALLFVDGEAGNDGTAEAQMPPLEIRVTGDDGHITRYRLGTSGQTLAPGERFAFSGRVELPRNRVKSVSVAFAG